MKRLDVSSPDNLPSSRCVRSSPVFSLWDGAFVLTLVFLVAVVFYLGRLSYLEGLRLDHAMANGRIWSEWLAHAHQNRFTNDFEPSFCRGHVVEHNDIATEMHNDHASRKSQKERGEWEACFLSLVDPGGAISQLMNPYTLKPLDYVESCQPLNSAHAGALQLEKVTGTVVAVASPLTYHDPVDRPFLIRVSVCDAAGYPQQVAQVLF